MSLSEELFPRVFSRVLLISPQSYCIAAGDRVNTCGKRRGETSSSLRGARLAARKSAGSKLRKQRVLSRRSRIQREAASSYQRCNLLRRCSPPPLIERLLNPLSRVGWLSKFESRGVLVLAGACQPETCWLVTWLVIQALPCPATRIRVHKHTSERHPS